MSLPRLPAVDELPALSTRHRADVLDLLFEPSQALHTLSVELLATRKFNSYDDLISAIGIQLTALAESSSLSDTEWLDEILQSHPRLGARKVESASSQAEQAQLQDNDNDEAEELRMLNDEYERTYSGLRYVVFVNGRGRSAIMNDMRERIARENISDERVSAIRVIDDVSRLSTMH